MVGVNSNKEMTEVIGHFITVSVFAVKRLAVISVLEDSGKQLNNHCIAVALVAAESFADAAECGEGGCSVSYHAQRLTCIAFNGLTVKTYDSSGVNVFTYSFIILNFSVLRNGACAVNKKVKLLVCGDTNG